MRFGLRGTWERNADIGEKKKKEMYKRSRALTTTDHLHWMDGVAAVASSSFVGDFGTD